MTSNSGHIVAMGGGGFSMEPENPLLDDYVLALSRRQPARICFIGTASAESMAYTLRFYRVFSGRAIASDLTIFDSPTLPRQPASGSDLAAFIGAQDILYVGGGNTANLLAIWRAHTLDAIIGDAWRRGLVLAGVSAGMLCWFTGGVTDSFGPLDVLDDGLGLIDASACPHYDGEALRRPTYHRAVAAGLRNGYAADDGAALHFHGTELVGAVSSRPHAAAYKVELVDGTVIETPLSTRYLGDLHR